MALPQDQRSCPSSSSRSVPGGHSDEGHPQRLPKHDYPGMLIVFEGIDGCGKGTQLSMLADELRQRTSTPETNWLKVITTKQPGDTPVGLAVRDILFHTVTTHNMEPNTASLLFLVSNVEQMAHNVIPALQAGNIVLSDRYSAYSDPAYAITLRRPVHPSIINLRAEISGPEPDLIFHFRGDPAKLLDRAKSRTSESHQKGKVWSNVDAMRRVQDFYDRMFSVVPPSVYFPIDAERDIDSIFAEVRTIACSRIRSRYDL